MSSVMMVSISGIAQQREFRVQFEKTHKVCPTSAIFEIYGIIGTSIFNHIYKGNCSMPKCAQGFWTLKGDFRGMTPITPGG